MNQKVWYTDILNDSEKEAAQSAGATLVVANDIRSAGPFPFEVMDGTQYRIEGGVLAFNANRKIFREKIMKKWAGVEEYNGILLKEAYLKALFWDNRRAGYLLAAMQQMPEGTVHLNRPQLHPCTPLKTQLQFLRTYVRSLKHGRFREPELNIPDGTTIGFLVEDLFEAGLLQNVAGRFSSSEICWVLPPYHRFSPEEIAQLKLQGSAVVICRSSGWVHLPFTLPFKFKSSECWMVQHMLHNMPAICSCLEWGSALFGSSLKVLVTVAQENTPFGHVLSRIAASKGKSVVNTMNGMKFGEANDFMTQFQCWIVWDEQMKQLLQEKAHTPEHQLRIGGSLGEDHVYGHVYGNRMPLQETEMQKRIISVMSTRDLRPDKVEALKTLYSWASDKDDVIILYRPHPAEKENHYYLPSSDQKADVRMVKPGAAESRQSLLDQLQASDLVINFGSTVSIESKWAGTPCITFEMKDKSWLYCVDQQQVFHMKTTDELTAYLNRMGKKNSTRGQASQNRIPSAEKYAEIIREFANLPSPSI